MAFVDGEEPVIAQIQALGPELCQASGINQLEFALFGGLLVSACEMLF